MNNETAESSGPFAHLETLAQRNATPRAEAKPTKEDRAKTNAKADRTDANNLDVWKKSVRLREKGRSRLTGKLLEVTLAPIPDRGEAHHIKSRTDKRVRYDRRNGVYLSLVEHDRAGRGLLRIEGTQFFEIDGQRYIDADELLRFTDTETGKVVIR